MPRPIEPCDELLDGIRARLHELDERIAALTESRRALRSYLDVTERTRRLRAASPPAAGSGSPRVSPRPGSGSRG
ncbi:MerR family DNA-binding protein [Pseudonocardia sp. S2-4]|uniref:MerR family DNA-binding protein n=1 Tax=Pseudonocardia humida TaxID=2800819 RepID=A0ABT1A0B0_9PSEU|nr:MerR family DNA-binding protein [Pseudonocardia humida]